jgi:nucleolar complex protein 2
MPTKKQQLTRRGVQIAKQKAVSRIKKSKADRTARSMRKAAEVEDQTDVLLRSTEGGMDADTFLEGGFEAMMSDSESGANEVDAELADEASEAEPAVPKRKKGAVSSHKDQLEALQKSDPEFFKYLQSTDQSLLAFGDDDEEEEEEDGEEEEEEEEDGEGEEGEEGEEAVGEESDGEEAMDAESGEEAGASEEGGGAAPAPVKSKSAPRPTVELSSHMIDGWTRALADASVHRQSLRMLVGAFRAAVRFGDEEGEAEGVDFVFSSSSVFNQLMQFCIFRMDAVLRAHIQGPAGSKQPQRTRGGVERVDTLPHWRSHQLLVKSYLLHLLRFVERLAQSMERQAEMLNAALSQLHRMVPLLLPFPKLCPRAVKALLRVWVAAEAGGQQSTLLAYATLRQLALEAPLLDACLKGLYLAYARGARSMSRVRLPRVVLLSSCVVDLCAADPQAAYQHAFVYIRQLAIHLRNAIQKTTDEAHRQVYSWQFINCVRLWAQVLCAIGKPTDSPLRQLVYPLVQITLGTARLLPNIRYAPLRFQCVRTLNQLSAELGVFIPVAPLLLDACRFAQLSKPAKKESKERPADWAVLIKVSKADADKYRYQEGMLSQALFLLAEHLHGLAYDVSFPEAAVPTVAALKRLAKSTKIAALQQRARRLAAQCDAQAAWVIRHRERVDFSPRDAAKAAAFLADEKEAGAGPFSRWFKGEVAAAEAREAELRAMAEARGPVRADAAGDSEEEEDEGESGDEGEAAARRKRKQHSKRERQRQAAQQQAALEAAAAEGGDQLATARDTVQDFTMSDLDD